MHLLRAHLHPCGRGFISAGTQAVRGRAPRQRTPSTYMGDPTVNTAFYRWGFIGGAQAGYNVQRGHFVFGPEADIGYLGISASKSFFQPGTDAGCVMTYPDHSYVAYGGWSCNVAGKYSVSSDLYGDLTARFGYEMDRTLLYAKGGAALLNADFKANYVGNNCTVLGPYCAGGRISRHYSWVYYFQIQSQRYTIGMDRRCRRRICFEPVLVCQSRIPALRLRKDFILVLWLLRLPPCQRQLPQSKLWQMSGGHAFMG